MPESFVWIPVRDGARLAATLYLPEGDEPRPAILEALPYRKDDVTAYDTPEYRRLRDEGNFAVCRLDLRGTGSSEGLATDEYPRREQKDLCDAIAWLAAQKWCTGKVGMYGTSYSGFNSIQVAMERPPALRAIIPIFATDDRYTDDVHYYGGARRGGDLPDYPLYMVAMNALPPVPSIAGEDWRETWKQRVDGLQPWLLRWLEEQTDGPYWRHGSLRPNYDSIQAATMIVAGWADGYRNATFRMFERLQCPKRMVIGPWSHTSTETSRPGPRVDLVPEMIRWFDHWLRDRDDGVERDPPLIVFVRRSTPPDGNLDNYEGEFRFEPTWPPTRAVEQRHPLGEARGPQTPELAVRPDVGICAPHWCASSVPYTQPFDQRPDEAFSLCYEWPPLPGELEILGYPRLELSVSSSAPVALVVAKLADVAPDGSSALVARGALNLTHRDSHTDPHPLEPERTYAVTVELDATSWVFEPGHRLRLAVAGSDWPNLWPPPQPLTLTVDTTHSALVLPTLDGPSPTPQAPVLAPPRREPARAPHEGPPVVWRLEHDVVAGERRLVSDHGAEADLEVGGHLSERYLATIGVSTEDPGRAYNRGRALFRLQWPETTAGAEARALLSSDATHFQLELELDVFENDRPLWSRRWERSYPRRLA